MARKPRKFCESQIYHVILRGNNKQILFCDDLDRKFFLNRLEKYSTELGISVFAYCLMSNHVHILLGKANPSLSKFVQKLATSYAMYFNRRYERSGHLFEGRFKSEPVETDEYFKTAIRYIFQNPLKVSIEKSLSYRWSSYLLTIKENRHSIIDKEYLFNLFETKQQFIDFMNQIETKECMEYESKRYYSDSYCIKVINKTFGYSSPTEMIWLSREEQKNKLRFLKEFGFSTNQLSRVTGISRRIVRKA